ncbi:MAG: transaldolase family protein, partial [Gemmatimonadota bacterium]
GARRQRPLWASTSTKNPALPDIYYVEALAAPDSVNTLPPDTLDAYRDHGDPRIRIREDLAGAHLTLTALGELGLNFGPPIAPVLEAVGLDVGQRLEAEGIDKFAASYDQLLDAIAKKQRQVQPA